MAGGCSLDRSPKHNWVENVGGLPEYMCVVARAIARGNPNLDRAIPIAIGRIEDWASGKGNVTAKTRAKAQSAVAEWEAKRARAKAKNLVSSADLNELDVLVASARSAEHAGKINSQVVSDRRLPDGRRIRTLTSGETEEFSSSAQVWLPFDGEPLSAAVDDGSDNHDIGGISDGADPVATADPADAVEAQDVADAASPEIDLGDGTTSGEDDTAPAPVGADGAWGAIVFNFPTQDPSDDPRVWQDWADMLAQGGGAEWLNGVVASGAQHPDDIGEGGPRFRIPVFLPEGIETGDRRVFAEGGTEFAPLPLPLLWQRETSDGHKGAIVVGRIDTIERLPDGGEFSGLGNATGIFDTSPDAREAVRQVRSKMLRGISADVDQFAATFSDQPEEDGRPGLTEIKHGRVIAGTLVAKPAFQECAIELDEDYELIVDGDNSGDAQAEQPVEGAEEAVVASAGQESTMSNGNVVTLPSSTGVGVGVVAAGGPVAPPKDWFENPNFSAPTHLDVDDQGRVAGHIALWSSSHTGRPETKPPRSRSGYQYFTTGRLRCEDGSDVAVGQLTLTGGHATLEADASAARKHYDDTQSAVADVVCGEDKFGIWVAGAMRPGLTDNQIRAFRASDPSGDWRPINGNLELIAVCQVNSPGFPVPQSLVASGEQLALVAAGTADLVRMGMESRLEARVAAIEAGLRAQKENELRARVAAVLNPGVPGISQMPTVPHDPRIAANPRQPRIPVTKQPVTNKKPKRQAAATSASAATTAAATKPKPKNTLPSGTKVTWHYRSAIGHGTVQSIAKQGSSHASTLYNVRQHDHHKGEPAVVQHYGAALTKVG